jgi:hypothetical protein
MKYEFGVLVEQYKQYKMKSSEKTSPSATSSTTNPTFEKGLCSEKSLMDCLSYGTALIAFMNKNST